MAISTFIKGVSPYKNVLVNDLILDKNGKKMSKSKGNTVSPFELFDKYGADATRWYLLTTSPAWTPTKFDEDGLIEVMSKFFGTLKNIYNFFVLYANNDDVDMDEIFVPYSSRSELDHWILSKYNRLIKDVTYHMDNYEHMKSVRAISEFVTEDLSNWYIRRSRRRFYDTHMSEDKKSVFTTTFEVLVGVSQLIAPFAPFISDEIYTDLTLEESVHLSYFPEVNEELIDSNVEKRMDVTRTIVSLGRGVREKEKIKVRQPLEKVLIDKKYRYVVGDFIDLIKEELNVKEVEFVSEIEEFMSYSLKPNFKLAGPSLGKKIKSFGKALSEVDPSLFIKELELEGKVSLDIDGENIEITKEFVDVRINAKEGFAVAMENNIFAILDTTITSKLEKEGIARELVSKVQQLRKQADFDMMDNIIIYVDPDKEVETSIIDFENHIKKETLAVEIKKKDDLKTFDLNGHETGIEVERV